MHSYHSPLVHSFTFTRSKSHKKSQKKVNFTSFRQVQQIKLAAFYIKNSLKYFIVPLPYQIVVLWLSMPGVVVEVVVAVVLSSSFSLSSRYLKHFDGS